MQDIQFLESSADILIIIQIRFIRGTEPLNDEGVQKIWNNSLTQQMFVASLIIIRTGCGWARNASPNEWRNAVLYMTWKLSSTEMLINEKLVLAVLNSSLVLVDDDDNDNPRPFQSSGHVNTCSKIPFYGPGHMTVLGQGSTSVWRAFAFYYYHRHYLLSLSPCNEMVGGKEGRRRSPRPTDSTQILDKAPIQPITWISNVFTYRVMRFNTYLINLLNYLLGLSLSPFIHIRNRYVQLKYEFCLFGATTTTHHHPHQCQAMNGLLIECVGGHRSSIIWRS